MGARGKSSTPQEHKGDTSQRLWGRWDQGLKAFVSCPSGTSQMPCLYVKPELAGTGLRRASGVLFLFNPFLKIGKLVLAEVGSVCLCCSSPA